MIDVGFSSATIPPKLSDSPPFLYPDKLIIMTFTPLSQHSFGLTGLIIYCKAIFLSFDKLIVSTINSMPQQSIVVTYFLMLI